MTLEARMRTALWGLYWLSNGATSRMDANRVTQSKDRPAFPSGEGFPLVDEFALRWAGAYSDRAQRECVEDAEKALASARRAPEPLNPEYREFHWRRMVAMDQRRADDVAQHWKISKRYVYKLRTQFREDAA